jgi:hypothetical protein
MPFARLPGATWRIKFAYTRKYVTYWLRCCIASYQCTDIAWFIHVLIRRRNHFFEQDFPSPGFLIKVDVFTLLAIGEDVLLIVVIYPFRDS